MYFEDIQFGLANVQFIQVISWINFQGYDANCNQGTSGSYNFRDKIVLSRSCEIFTNSSNFYPLHPTVIIIIGKLKGQCIVYEAV